METTHSSMVDSETSPREVVKFVLVICLITAVSIWLSLSFGPFTLANWMRWFMGVFLLVFGTFKLIGYSMFTEMFAGYDVIAKRIKLYAQLYPFIELVLALSYILNVVPLARDVATLVVMAIGSVGVAQELKKRTGIHCACLGNVIKLPLSTVSLVEDVGMGAMAIVMLVIR